MFPLTAQLKQSTRLWAARRCHAPAIVGLRCQSLSILNKEMNMTCKRLTGLSAVAFALLALTGTARAEGECSAATLRGSYAFSAHGELLGILDTSVSPPMLNALTTPIIIDGVAIQTFDGSGSFTRTDFLNTNGSPRAGQTTFNPNQHGTYTVNADCTGTMHIVYDNGTVLDAQIALAENGKVVKGIISDETVPSFVPVPGASCATGCALGVQVSLDGQQTRDHNRDH
jgi:hypothetical protein